MLLRRRKEAAIDANVAVCRQMISMMVRCVWEVMSMMTVIIGRMIAVVVVIWSITIGGGILWIVPCRRETGVVGVVTAVVMVFVVVDWFEELILLLRR